MRRAPSDGPLLGRRLAGSHPALPLVHWGLETNPLLCAAPPLERAGSRWRLAGQHPLIGPGCLNVLQRSPVEAPAPRLLKREGCDQLAMSAVAQTGGAQKLHLTSGPMEAKSQRSEVADGSRLSPILGMALWGRE